MTVPAQALLSKAEARSLTDEVRADAELLWLKLVELYEGGAHTVLGYSSWGAYFKQEFGGEKSQAYRILDAGRVAAALDSPIGERASIREAQARELTPLLKQPEKLREAWAEVITITPEPTAVQVREVVQRKVNPEYPKEVQPDPRAPVPTLKTAAREVVAAAVREGASYRVPATAMNALILAIGKAA